MSLARAWTRQLYGASGAAVLVPGTVLVALVLLAIAGGFGRLGSLGQAVAGPSVPAGPPLIGTVVHARAGATAGPPVIAAAPAGAVAAPSPTSVTPTGAVVAPITGGGVTTGVGSGTGASAGHSGRGSGGGSGGSSRSGGRGGSGSSGTGGSGSGGSGAPQPTLWDGVTKLGTSVTNKLPAPVGSLGGQVLQSVGSTLDKILPLPGGNTGGGQTAAAPNSLLSALKHL